MLNESNETKTVMEPNVQLSKREGVEAITEGEINIGMTAPIVLPLVEEQLAGWYEPRFRELLQLYPGTYKQVVAK